MKRNVGLLVLITIALVLSFASVASAVPKNPPNDNQCICHETQHNNKHADGSQKGVIICVDPSSLPNNKHFKHGDGCVTPVKEVNEDVCAEADAAPVSPEVCEGTLVCDPETQPFQTECCSISEAFCGLLECQGTSHPQCDGG